MPIFTSAFIAATRATGAIRAAKFTTILVTALPMPAAMGAKAAVIANRAIVARSKVLISLALIWARPIMRPRTASTIAIARFVGSTKPPITDSAMPMQKSTKLSIPKVLFTSYLPPFLF